MIILAPTDESEKYFSGMAMNSWNNYLLRCPDTQEEMKSGNKTLIISCDLKLGNETVSVKLHYRILKNTLYCFIEEI